MKENYEKKYQATLKEVVDKQKEARNANKPPPPSGLKSGPTAAGMIVLEEERKREREREKKREQLQEKEKAEQQEEEDKDSMDVDEPADSGKGKGRK